MTRPAYYNEFDPFAAQWLRNLIDAGHLPGGDVDERSICDVSPDDLRGYGQFHFFAGIGGWPLALRMVGIPDDAPVWTGSCPCQPFSAAGKQQGRDDGRHLWPIFYSLICAGRPKYVFGEQVAAAVAHGWLDDLQTDLEAQGYAVGSVVLGAHSVGAPHIRQRLYWGAVADTDDARLERWRGAGSECPVEQPIGPPSLDRFWAQSELLECSDGKARHVEPGIFPLAHGVPGRVGRLRAYGNAIVPQVAAEFVRAFAAL